MDSYRVPSNMNNTVVDILSKNEDIENQYIANKQKKIEQNAHSLFMLSFAQKDKKEMIKQEYNKIMTQREKESCSFKPLLISPKKQIDSELLKMNFDERRDQIKQKFTEKYEKIKTEKSKYEVDSCTFKPELRKRSLPNYEKKIPENKVLKNYLERQKQAFVKKIMIKI